MCAQGSGPERRLCLGWGESSLTLVGRPLLHPEPVLPRPPCMVLNALL